MIHLSENRVISYLIQNRLVSPSDSENIGVKFLEQAGANLAFLISIAGESLWIIRQPRINFTTRVFSQNSLSQEAAFYKWVKSAEIEQALKAAIPELVLFDSQNRIIITRYFNNYENLAEYHQRLGRYPVKLAQNLAAIISDLHKDSYLYPEKFTSIKEQMGVCSLDALGIRVSPEQVAFFPLEGSKLISLIQNNAEMYAAIQGVENSWQACCLIHRDLKLTNILKHRTTKAANAHLVVIDWELCKWGDPAWDVASIMGDYLRCWLASIVPQAGLPIDDWFSHAKLPLSKVLPSIKSFWYTYITNTKCFADLRPNYREIVMQFTGLYLLNVALTSLIWQGHLSSKSLCLLQVSNNLLVEPDHAADIFLSQ